MGDITRDVRKLLPLRRRGLPFSHDVGQPPLANLRDVLYCGGTADKKCPQGISTGGRGRPAVSKQQTTLNGSVRPNGVAVNTPVAVPAFDWNGAAYLGERSQCGPDGHTCDLCGRRIGAFRWMKPVKVDTRLPQRAAWSSKRIGWACASHQRVDPTWRPNVPVSDKTARAVHLLRYLLDGPSGDSDVGATVREIRQALGLSQEKLAAQLGYSTWTVRAWEHGKARPKSYVIALLQSWCESLNSDVP